MNLINIFAPQWKIAESYGRVAIELARDLERLGLTVNRIGVDAPRNRPIIPSFGGVVLGYPTNIDAAYGVLAKAGPRIMLTMFESTLLPPLWKDILNQMDAVIVPAQFLVEVFRDSGVRVPIHVQPVGVSRTFRYVQRPADRSPYTFLAIADRGARKGWMSAGQAFIRAFGEDTRYKLLFKIRPHSLEKIARFSNPNIEMVREEMSDRQLAALYGQTDCLIFPSFGEGQGLPPLEYAATGGPVIATNWGGMADHLHQWGYPINYRMVPAWGSDAQFGGLGQWSEPDVDDLAATMKFVASHREYALTRAADASKFVRRFYTWRKLSRLVAGIWEEIKDKHGKRTLWTAAS